MNSARIASYLMIGLLVMCSASASAQTQAAPRTAGSLVGAWLVNVEGEAATRTLVISDEASTSTGALLSAKYGMTTKGQGPIEAKMVRVGEQRQLNLITQAATVITATEQSDGTFTGLFVLKNGSIKKVSIARTADANHQGRPQAQPMGQPPEIVMVYMGGDDCRPCVNWLAFELPKLQATEAFKSITFVHVEKSIASTVPPRFFLPSKVKPLKEKLDTASGGNRGSAQVAIFVNGEVYDYYFGSRPATHIEQMILSILNSSPYPAQRCIQRTAHWRCAVVGQP